MCFHYARIVGKEKSSGVKCENHIQGGYMLGGTAGFAANHARDLLGSRIAHTVLSPRRARHGMWRPAACGIGAARARGGL